MRILLTADLHLTDKKVDEYRWDIFNQINKYIDKYNVDYLFILGDITDKWDRHSSYLVNRLTDELNYLAQKVYIYILRGNHDCNDPQMPFFKFLNFHDHIQFIIDPTEVTLKDGTKCLFVPHSRQPDEDWFENGQPIWNDEYEYLFFHQCFLGAQTPGGFKLDGVDVSFDNFDGAIYAGDIHTPQTVGPVTYVGSPYAIKHGDCDGRMLLIDGNEEVELETDFPSKHSIKINNPTEMKPMEFRPGDSLKVTLELYGADRLEWRQHKQEIIDWAEEKQVKLAECEVVVVSQEAEAEQQQVDDTVIESEQEIYQQFCSQRDIPDYVKEIGEQLLQEVSEQT